MNDSHIPKSVSEATSVSGRGRRLNRRGAETQQRILRVATRLLSEVSPGEVSANLITREAKVTWGTLQHHFGDTDGMWAAVLDYLAANRAMVAEIRCKDSSQSGVAQIVNGLWIDYDSLEARAVWTLRCALPADLDTLRRDYPFTTRAIARWDRAWRLAYAQAFQGMVVDAYRLEQVRHLLPPAVRGLYQEHQLSTWTDVEEARAGLIDAMTAYLEPQQSVTP